MLQCAGVSDVSQQYLNCSVGALNQQTNLPNTELFVCTELSLQTCVSASFCIPQHQIIIIKTNEFAKLAYNGMIGTTLHNRNRFLGKFTCWELVSYCSPRPPLRGGMRGVSDLCSSPLPEGKIRIVWLYFKRSFHVVMFGCSQFPMSVNLCFLPN